MFNSAILLSDDLLAEIISISISSMISGFFRRTKDGNGEICARGKIISSGYYKMPQETAESFKDGWFYTGDKGYLDEEDYL